MTRPVVVIGAGGFGRETLDVLDAIRNSSSGDVPLVLGVLDDDPSAANRTRLRDRQVDWLGRIDDWLSSDPDADVLICIGEPAARRRVADRLGRRAGPPAVHPSAGIGSGLVLAQGVVICAGVQISTNVALGEHVHVNPNATIGHDATIGAFSSVNPGAIISGGVRIGEGVLVGAGAVVLQDLVVGDGAVIGAGACVVRDVVAGTTVKGVPAR